MKKNINRIIDYQNTILLLLKEKFPSLLLGVLITSVLSFTILNKVGIRKESAKVPERNSRLETVKTYTVKLNDDLWGIAERMYGSGFNAKDIADANKLIEPYTLTESQILIIPPVASKKPTRGEVTQKAAQTQQITEYTVLSGEYLWQIAEKVYGDGNQMSKLIEGNNIPYPYNVEEGQTLLVP